MTITSAYLCRRPREFEEYRAEIQMHLYCQDGMSECVQRMQRRCLAALDEFAPPRWALRWRTPRAYAEPGELTAVMEELFPGEPKRLADEHDRQMAARVVLFDDGPRDEEAA